MDIKKQDLGKNQYKFSVKLASEEWSKYIDQAVTQLSADMKIKGFREGKAPIEMVKSVFGETKLAQAAGEIALQDIYVAIIEQEKVLPVGQPKVVFDKLVLNEPLEVTFEIADLPEAKVGDYSKLRLKGTKPAEVTDAQVMDVVENLRKRSANFVEVERPVEKGDWVEIDFFGTLDGVAFEGGASQHHPLVVGDGAFVPGFEDAMIGMNNGEEKEFDIVFPKDFHKDSLAGKNVHFKIKLHQHKAVEQAELNDEFVKKNSRFATLEELKADIRKFLEGDAANRLAALEEEEAIDELVKITKVDLPDSLVDSEVDAMIDEYKGRLASTPGLTWEGYLEKVGKTEEELRKEMRQSAEKRIVASLAIAHLKKQENISVDDKEIEAEIDKIKAGNPQLKDKIDSQFADSHERQRLQSAIGGRKAVAKLMEIVRQK